MGVRIIAVLIIAVASGTASPARGQLRVQLPRADGRPGRTAVLTLRYGSFAIEPPCTEKQPANLCMQL